MITQICLLLHNIRSIHNVGSIFRTSDAARVSRIYLSGYTPLPIDRFGRIRQDISKVALGAEKTVDWEYVKDINRFIRKMKNEKVKIIGVEQDKRSIDFRKLDNINKVLIILGEEVNGIPKNILDKCDEIIEIPMYGKKESLNVAVTAGIILYTLR